MCQIDRNINRLRHWVRDVTDAALLDHRVGLWDVIAICIGLIQAEAHFM